MLTGACHGDTGEIQMGTLEKFRWGHHRLALAVVYYKTCLSTVSLSGLLSVVFT